MRLEDNIKRATNAGFLSIGLIGVFNAVSLMRGPHWRLENDEALLLATDLNNALTAILPPEYLEVYNGILAKYSPIVGCALTATAVIGKRVAIDRELAAQKLSPRPDQPGQQRSTGTNPGDIGRDGFSSNHPGGHGPVNGATDFGVGGGDTW